MRYIFGDCTLDTQRYELRRGGERVPLRRKVFQVLVYLLEQRDRVVPRDEILAQVWPDQYVGEESLTSCIKAVRRAVGDSGRAQRVIQTVHGHGLRFVAEVTVAETAPASSPALAPPLPLASPPLQALVGREAEVATLHGWYATAKLSPQFHKSLKVCQNPCGVEEQTRTAGARRWWQDPAQESGSVDGRNSRTSWRRCLVARCTRNAWPR